MKTTMVGHKHAGKDAAMATVLSELESWHGKDVFALLSTVTDQHTPIPETQSTTAIIRLSLDGFRKTL